MYFLLSLLEGSAMRNSKTTAPIDLIFLHNYTHGSVLQDDLDSIIYLKLKYAIKVRIDVKHALWWEHIFKHTSEINQVSGPDSLSSHGMIYGIAYLVHNRQKMQRSKSKSE